MCGLLGSLGAHNNTSNANNNNKNDKNKTILMQISINENKITILIPIITLRIMAN